MSVKTYVILAVLLFGDNNQSKEIYKPPLQFFLTNLTICLNYTIVFLIYQQPAGGKTRTVVSVTTDFPGTRTGLVLLYLSVRVTERNERDKKLNLYACR